MLHAAFTMQDVGAGKSDDVGVCLYVHEAGHAAILLVIYMF